MRFLLTIIIPTYGRPQLLLRAVNSALAQKLASGDESIEVLVIDDGSPEPPVLPTHPCLKVVRLPVNKGGAAARNEGARRARGKYITYLDDDDQLLPEMAKTALSALQGDACQSLPQPVGVLGGIEVINQVGDITETRLPPVLPKGSHFGLEEIDPSKSFLCKQTLVIEKDVLLAIGGFDENFQSRVHSELFLRLNQACSLLGLPVATYRLMAHQGVRVSGNLTLRQQSFEQLVSKHRALFEAHPKQFAHFLYRHAQKSFLLGQKSAALRALVWAFRVQPFHSTLVVGGELKALLRQEAIKRLAARG